MRIHYIFTLAACSLVLFSGCTTTTRGSSSLEQEVEALRTEVADIKASERLSDARGGGGTVSNDVTSLRMDVQRISENVDTSGQGGLTLRQQLDTLNARLDRLEQRSGQAPSGAVGSATNPASRPYQSGPYYGPSSADQATATPVADSAGPYDLAKNLFDQKKYSEATAQFKSYLKAEPKGTQAAAAQFYIGECLYSQKKYEESILEYQKVIQGFPKSPQVPTALLKQGHCFLAIGDKGSAKLLYQKVMRDFPKNYAAEVAKERLKSV